MSGPVFAIGGHEDRSGDRVILREVVAALPRHRLVVATVASRHPEEMFDEYRNAFGDMDVELVHLHVDDHARADDTTALDGAGGVFFTGGSQLRITRMIGQSPLQHGIVRLWREGGVLAGTSAGASVLTETMIVRGKSEEASRVGELDTSHGLGVLPTLVIDQHFAQRGRIGRLVAAVAEHPALLGIGIDENTAIAVRGTVAEVIGEGGVTVLDASELSATNFDERFEDATLSVFDLRAHFLAQGDRLDLESRRPSTAEQDPVADRSRRLPR